MVSSSLYLACPVMVQILSRSGASSAWLLLPADRPCHVQWQTALSCDGKIRMCDWSVALSCHASQKSPLLGYLLKGWIEFCSWSSEDDMLLSIKRSVVSNCRIVSLLLLAIFVASPRFVCVNTMRESSRCASLHDARVW